MTTREALHAHLAAHKEAPVYERVYFFHAHIYYDQSDPGEAAKMAALDPQLRKHFEAHEHVKVQDLKASDAGC